MSDQRVSRKVGVLSFGKVLAVAAFCNSLAAQGVVTTLAGTDYAFPLATTQGLAAPLGRVEDLAMDSQGNVYFSDSVNAIIGRLTPAGSFTVVAGNGIRGYSGDGGLAIHASLHGPRRLVLDGRGNVYFVDDVENVFAASRIRRVNADGIITTVAGNGSFNYVCPITPVSASSPLGPVGGLAVDSAGTLYISDQVCGIYRLNANGTLSTLSFKSHGPLLIDSSGRFYISFNAQIFRVSDDGSNPVLIAGSVDQNSYFGGDGGLATAARICGNANGGGLGLTLDSSGSLYVADFCNNRVRRIGPDGTINTIAGNGNSAFPSGGANNPLLQLGISGGEFSGDGGAATAAGLRNPKAVAVAANGDIYIADSDNGRVRRVRIGVITTVAGSGLYRYAGDGGPANSSVFNYPTAIAVDSAGNAYVADAGAHVVRRISSAGVVTTFAGTGEEGFSGDGGPATRARLSFPNAVAVDSGGNVYIAQYRGVRRVNPQGVIITFAGDNGLSSPPEVRGFIGNNFYALAVDPAGNLLLAADSVLYRITPSRAVTRVAGSGAAGFGGDNVPAVSVGLGIIFSVAADASGNIYIGAINNPIHKVTSDGRIFRFSDSCCGFSEDGTLVRAAKFNNALGFAMDAQANLYIADSGSNRVRKVGSDGILHTVAGSGAVGFGAGGLSGDGHLATSARFNAPWGIAFDPGGNLLIVDSLNQRVRKVLSQPPGIQANPASLTFSASSGGAPAPIQRLSVVATIPGVACTISVPSTNAEWLAVSPLAAETPRLIEVTANPANLPPGTYHSTITIDSPAASPASTTVAVTLNVSDAMGPVLQVDKLNLSFPFARGSGPRTEPVNVANTGGGSLEFEVRAETSTGGTWLSVSPGMGQVRPGNPATVAVTADPKGLLAGTYTGQVTVIGKSDQKIIPVTMTISPLDHAILLSHTGLSFTAVSQGGVVPPQSFAVLNIGTGAVSWSVSKSTLSGGQDWLQITPASGSTNSAATATPVVSVSVDAAALPPGRYYGLVRVDAPGAANTPQVLTVFLDVLKPDADVGPVVQPAELIFTTTAGGQSPGSQEVLVYNLTPTPNTFRSSIVTDTGLPLIIVPRDATLNPQVPARIVVQPLTSGLSPGVYSGAFTLQFSDGRVRSAQVTIADSTTVSNSSSSSRPLTSVNPADPGLCTPKQLLPALTTLGQSFEVSAGWPVSLVANVLDNCGSPLEAGSVTASFSNGDQAVTLRPLKEGRWAGTWPTRAASLAQVTLKLHAEDPQRQIHGDREVSGTLQSQQDPPVFEKNQVFSVAGGPPYVPVAPGGAISIYGDRLAEIDLAAQSTPLPTILANTEVMMAGLKLPLYFAGQKQVNAIVPYRLNANTQQQLLVRRGLTYSSPVPVDVAEAQPAVLNGGPPDYAGLIYAYPRDGSAPYQVTASTPAHSGDILTLTCFGLGAVDPSVSDGNPPGEKSSSTTNNPQVLIGGIAAEVLFSGLAPGFAGLYQVNVTVPANVTAGPAIPVRVSVAGQTAPPVTVPIQ